MKAVALLLAALAASARAAGDGPYWLQSYAPPAYHEILNAELEVKSLDAVEKIVAAIQNVSPYTSSLRPKYRRT